MSVNPRVSLFNNTNYTYDNIDRLTQAGSDSFSYDKAGNNLNNNALYNLLNNQLKSSDIYTITYDSMGNIKTKYNKLTKTTSNYTFNSRNQLINYRQTDENNQTTKTLTYTYDAFNRRVSKIEDGTEQRYLYDGDDIVAILDNNNQVIAAITYDESIDTPLSITNANGTFYYHRDHQGSIIALTDSSGQVVESFTYDNHYGTITNHTKTVETNNPYAYTGRELDTNELYYYRARYYDPQIERFLGEDPIGFASKDTNWYRYVHNSPINLRDPSGLYGTGSCQYYKKRCKQTGDWYYCSVASTMCNLFPDKPNTWFNCVRKCLQDYDDVACDSCDSEAGRTTCAVPAHVNCFVMCGISSNDPIWDGR